MASSSALTLELKATVDGAVREFLDSGDVSEVVRRLQVSEPIPQYGVEVVKRIVYRAIDAPDNVRETLAGLLSSLQVWGSVPYSDIERAVSVLASRVADMKLDTTLLEDRFAALLAFLIQDDAISEGW